MIIPSEVILVRHSKSESNFVVEESKKGNDSFYTDEYKARPMHTWRLTEDEKVQPQITGEWIKSHVGDSFYRYFVSESHRTFETAALLGLPNAQWVIDDRLRERDWGDVGSISRAEFREKYPQNALIKKVDKIHWRPPNGESLLDVRQRVKDFFNTLPDDCEGKRIIIVTHGELMWAAIAEFENMTNLELLEAQEDPVRKIHNAHVLQYTKINPVSKELEYHSDFKWVRSITPWLDENPSEWRQITRMMYSNEALLAQIERGEGKGNRSRGEII